MDELNLYVSAEEEPEVFDTQEFCGALFVNEDGEYATCVLHAHPPQNGHCDGVDRCEDYCDDPISDLCVSTGLVDSHGFPTLEYFEHFEVAT